MNMWLTASIKILPWRSCVWRCRHISSRLSRSVICRCFRRPDVRRLRSEALLSSRRSKTRSQRAQETLLGSFPSLFAELAILLVPHASRSSNECKSGSCRDRHLYPNRTLLDFEPAVGGSEMASFVFYPRAMARTDLQALALRWRMSLLWPSQSDAAVSQSDGTSCSLSRSQ
jgi:hypothetical protein